MSHTAPSYVWGTIHLDIIFYKLRIYILYNGAVVDDTEEISDFLGFHEEASVSSGGSMGEVMRQVVGKSERWPLAIFSLLRITLLQVSISTFNHWVLLSKAFTNSYVLLNPLFYLVYHNELRKLVLGAQVVNLETDYPLLHTEYIHEF